MRVRRTQVTDLFAPYPIMERIASNLQIEDLHNLALTSQAAYDHIGARLKTLRNLEQMAECKGRGAEWGRDIDIPWIYSWAEYVPDEVFECTGTGKEVCETCNATICDVRIPLIFTPSSLQFISPPLILHTSLHLQNKVKCH